MPDTRRISSCPSSDGGSQSDYINQHVENDAESYEPPPEKTPDYPDYLDVLPDDQNVSQQNLASSLNSGQSYQNIENDDNDDDSDSQHYINVNEDREPATETPVGSLESCSSDGQGSSDYVNAPKQINYHMGWPETPRLESPSDYTRDFLYHKITLFRKLKRHILSTDLNVDKNVGQMDRIILRNLFCKKIRTL